jgi:hypothetical protein
MFQLLCTWGNVLCLCTSYVSLMSDLCHVASDVCFKTEKSESCASYPEMWDSVRAYFRKTIGPSPYTVRVVPDRCFDVWDICHSCVKWELSDKFWTEYHRGHIGTKFKTVFELILDAYSSENWALLKWLRWRNIDARLRILRRTLHSNKAKNLGLLDTWVLTESYCS